MSEDFKIKLRAVGLSHIVVASGFCLSVLVGFAQKIMNKISRFAGFASATILVILFILVAGLSPSLLRAGLVSSMVLTAHYYGRKFHPGRLSAYAIAISMIINPIIIKSLAWQLSLASYGGIMFLSPILKEYFYGKSASYIGEMIIVAFSAQLFCLPITIYSFGELSVISILANILVTPIIPLVMALTFLGGISLKTTPVAFFCKKLLSLQVFVINRLSEIRWAIVPIRSGNPFIFALYLPIILFLVYLKNRTKYSFRPRYALDKIPEYGKIYTC